MAVIQIDSYEGVDKWNLCFKKHVNSLIEIKELVISSQRERVRKLYPLFSSIIEDSISLDLLLQHSRTNQSYIISRALLERVINFSYIQYATNEEFTSYIDYTMNKAARSLSRNLTLNGDVKCGLHFRSENFSLPEEYQEAINKFTSSKGKEIPRWTQVSIDNRANLLDSMTGQNLFIHIMMIYGDASEALHGTLYGSLFHLGVYNIGSVPSDQESLIKNTCTVKSFLYFMASSAIQTIFYCLSDKGIIEKHHYKQAKDLFLATSKETDLHPK